MFEPRDPQRGVRMYVCGPTVYDYAHLGNARAMVVFDVLFRILRSLYDEVTFVRNITDVDDKIYAASCREGVSCAEIAQKFEKEFLQDMHALSVLDPTESPHATKHIPEIIQMIQQLLANGSAYVADGHVLFSVDSFLGYGQLARKTMSELMAGARVDVASYKRKPYDFVLWKPSEGSWPGWESPWGWGRPGWHIECSAMCAAYFGNSFDIHGGGIDLIFPHHENERAQSVCAHGIPETARFWIHNGHLMVNGTKMSKSLGNFLTVRDLLQTTHPEVIRYALLSAHYRQPLDWTPELVAMSKQIVTKWYRVFQQSEVSFWEEIHENPTEEMGVLVNDFEAALMDDMNTPLALQKLNAMVQLSARTGRDVAAVARCGHLVGLLLHNPEDFFVRPVEDEEAIAALVEERRQAKEAKDYKKADAIRDELRQRGIGLEDSPQGTTWYRI